MEVPHPGSEGFVQVERNLAVQINWWVITGGPSAGKTTLLDRFAEMGYRTVSEAARLIIDEGMAEGKSLDEIRGDRVSFQSVVFDKKEQAEANLPTDELVLLDRGSQGDTLVYLSLALGAAGLDFNQDFPGKDAILAPATRRYKGVFIADLLPFESDYARRESAEEAELIHRLLGDTYKMLGYEPVSVPVLPVDERVNFIMNHIRETE